MVIAIGDPLAGPKDSTAEPFGLTPPGLGINVQVEVHFRDEFSGYGNVPRMNSADAAIA
jgi:hypothetical protein